MKYIREKKIIFTLQLVSNNNIGILDKLKQAVNWVQD